MDNQQSQNNEKKNIDEMTNIELLDVLWTALNKANSKGVFIIDEAFTLKVIHEKLKKNIN